MFTSLHSALGIWLFPLSVLAQDLVVPVLNGRIPDQFESPTLSTITIELDDHFGTEPILNDMVRLEGNYEDDDNNLVTANLDFLLFSERTPISRDNFLGYADRGDYLTSMVHRSVSDFVVQGGGFIPSFEGANLSLDDVPIQAPITNEFGVSNTERTVSMAKQGGDPNSATSQWFVSLGANSDNLDNQNGGFTVFGRISQSTFPNAQLLDPVTLNSPFQTATVEGIPSVPVHQSFFADPAPPLTLGDFFRIASSNRIPVPASEAGSSTDLNYTVSSSNELDFSASISGSTLQIDYLSPTRGAFALFTVTATDSVGNEVEETFSVSVSIDYETWRNQVFTAEQQNDDLISGPMADANDDGRTNLQAFAQGIDPFEKITSDFISITPDFANFLVFLSFRTNSNIIGVDFFLEESSDLITWTPASATTISSIVEPRGIRTFTRPLILNDENQIAVSPKRFYRLAFALSS